MSAYSTAHGPEAAVDLVVANDRHGLETTQALIAEVIHPGMSGGSLI